MIASKTENNLSGCNNNSPPCKSNSKYPKASASSASFLMAPRSKYSLTWSPFGELVKQYLHLRLQALLKFKSIPLVLFPTLPSFFVHKNKNFLVFQPILVCLVMRMLSAFIFYNVKFFYIAEVSLFAALILFLVQYNLAHDNKDRLLKNLYYKLYL